MIGDEWPLGQAEFERLLGLMPDLTDEEMQILAPRDEDDLGLAVNLLLYAHYVDAVDRGSKVYFGEYEALCGYRDDLEVGLASMVDTPFRKRLIDAIDLVDQQYLGCTVSRPLKPTRPPANHHWWWWYRSPRRVDQRLWLEEEQGLR